MNEDEKPPTKFLVVGIITSEDFQKSRYAVCKLHQSFPKEFDSPDIRPMLDVEWNEFITKYRRRLGDGLWSVQNRVVIFKNGEFLGDFGDLKALIWKKWKYIFNRDWHDLASRHLAEYLDEKVAAHCRQLVYLTIAVSSRVIGSLLFELYSDIVPLACENFITRCRNEDKGYCGTPIHRIVKSSWVQCGGYSLKPIRMPCENYVVPHNRRGVLSMCNNARHRDNSTQFYISLASAPWMDYRYVAFGQLIHGDDILKTIEDVPTYYQAPVHDIVIVKCGEYRTGLQTADSNLLYTADEIDQWKEIQQQMDILTYLRSYHNVDGGEGRRDSTKYFEVLQPKESYDSVLHPSKVKFGTYSIKSDVKSQGPFSHLPDIQSDDDGDEGAEDYDICGPGYSIRKHKNKMYDDSLTPRASDITL